LSDKPLAGQVAIVTGSSRGIGRATAAYLASLGATLAVSYIRSKDLAEELAEAVRKNGGEAEAFQADLTTPEGGATLVQRTVDRFGSLDILVCNVGGFVKKPFDQTTVEEWREQFAQNTDTMFHCIRAALPHMKAKHHGRIVNFGVAGAEFPVRQTGFVAYAAAKAAVVGFSRALAREVAPDGVTVNVVAPGIISENAPTRDDARAIGFVKHTPVGRVGSYQDVAEAVAFLVRPESDYITGTVLEVGGGWRV
jgi:3-oxoacyl-[acyl-carrier protein] reductase